MHPQGAAVRGTAVARRHCDKKSFKNGVQRVKVTASHVLAAMHQNKLLELLNEILRWDMKLRVAAVDAFFYPDVMVTCDARDRQADLFVEHPLQIVEILSDSTADYDRGAKFFSYSQIAELQEYVLIDIEARRVEVFSRQPGNEWLLHDYGGEPTCRFNSVNLTLEVARAFEDVAVEPGPEQHDSRIDSA